MLRKRVTEGRTIEDRTAAAYVSLPRLRKEAMVGLGCRALLVQELATDEVGAHEGHAVPKEVSHRGVAYPLRIKRGG